MNASECKSKVWWFLFCPICKSYSYPGSLSVRTVRDEARFFIWL